MKTIKIKHKDYDKICQKMYQKGYLRMTDMISNEYDWIDIFYKDYCTLSGFSGRVKFYLKFLIKNKIVILDYEKI